MLGAIAHADLDLPSVTPLQAQELAFNGLGYEASELAKSSSVAFTPVVGEILANAARRDAVRSLAVSTTATTATAILESHGVRCLVFKGPALAYMTRGTWLGRGSCL